MTQLIYLIGKAGTGKYTIAKELAKSGYIICDSQLINNPIFTLIDYDGFMDVPEFAWKATEDIRDILLNFIANEKTKNYILTNWLGGDGTPHDENDKSSTYNRVKNAALERNSLFVPVKLTISLEENKRRIMNSERSLRYKSLVLEEGHYQPLINIKDPNLLELDVTNLSAVEASVEILNFIEKII